jgi:hypothetical protein
MKQQEIHPEEKVAHVRKSKIPQTSTRQCTAFLELLFQCLQDSGQVCIEDGKVFIATLPLCVFHSDMVSQPHSLGNLTSRFFWVCLMKELIERSIQAPAESQNKMRAFCPRLIRILAQERREGKRITKEETNLALFFVLLKTRALPKEIQSLRSAILNPILKPLEPNE